MQLSDLIRNLRKSRDLSQAELAKKLKCDKSYISKLEGGKFENPSDEFLTKLAGFSGQSLEELQLICGRLPESVVKSVIQEMRKG